MYAIIRRWLTAPRSCSKTSSERKRTQVGWCTASQAFRSAPPSNWKSFSKWLRSNRRLRTNTMVDETTAPEIVEGKVLYKKHSLAIRWFHWINFPVLFVMIWSGLLIYWANPVFHVGKFGLQFPDWFLSPKIPGNLIASTS